jgi:hypothetical protein
MRGLSAHARAPGGDHSLARAPSCVSAARAAANVLCAQDSFRLLVSIHNQPSSAVCPPLSTCHAHSRGCVVPSSPTSPTPAHEHHRAMSTERSNTRPRRVLPSASPARMPSREPVLSPGAPPTIGSARSFTSRDAYYTAHDSDRRGLDRHALQHEHVPGADRYPACDHAGADPALLVCPCGRAHGDASIPHAFGTSITGPRFSHSSHSHLRRR